MCPGWLRCILDYYNKKYNANNVFHNALNKIARVTGLMNNGDKDLNDTILNDRHIRNQMNVIV
jgi:hypothetical protein